MAEHALSRTRIVRLAVCLGALLTAGGLPSVTRAQLRPAPEHVEVADGVHLFRTAAYGPVGLDGNSVVVIGGEGVLVFDTNGTPAAAEAVLAEIRQRTDLPVRWVVSSHWHWDHWYGTEVYRRAFPDVRVIAQTRTAALMRGPALEFNRPGLEEQLPGFIDVLERRVAESAALDPQPEDLPSLREMLSQSRFFLEQKKGAQLVFPDVTFEARLDLDLGGRTVHVLSHGRAVTPGDAFLYLPDGEILVTGDLLIHPVTFALSAYPSEWLAVMERLDALDADVIVPGHGAPMQDEGHLHATMDAMRALLTLGRGAHERGLDPDEAREEIVPKIRDLMVRITGDDPRVNQAFETQFVDWFLHRLWEEIEGPLSDAIAPIPLR